MDSKDKQNFINILILIQTICLLSVLITSCSRNQLIKNVDEEKNKVNGVKKVEKLNSPEAYQFILGPRDEISIKVWRNDDLNRSVQVDPSGNIQFPLIGEVKVSGLTIFQLKKSMTMMLSKYIVDPDVDINVTSLKNLKIYVLGEVQSPGTFDWRSGMLAWEGIAQAGGFTTDANENNILLVRSENGKAAIKTLNLQSILKGENLTQDLFLRNGDVIYVIPLVIVDVQRFMNRLYNIITPLVNIESGIILYPQVRDVLKGKETSGTFVVPNN